jgi:hypothetical protein
VSVFDYNMCVYHWLYFYFYHIKQYNNTQVTDPDIALDMWYNNTQVTHPDIALDMWYNNTQVTDPDIALDMWYEYYYNIYQELYLGV